MDNIIQFPPLRAQNEYARKIEDIGRMLLDLLTDFGKTVDPDTAHLRLLRDLHEVPDIQLSTWGLIAIDQITVGREITTTLSTRLREWRVPEFAVQAHTEFLRVETKFATECPETVDVSEDLAQDLYNYYSTGFPEFIDVGMVDITAFALRILIQQPGVRVVHSGMVEGRYKLVLAEKLHDAQFAIVELTIDALPLFLDHAARQLVMENIEP